MVSATARNKTFSFNRKNKMAGFLKGGGWDTMLKTDQPLTAVLPCSRQSRDFASDF